MNSVIFFKAIIASVFWSLSNKIFLNYEADKLYYYSLLSH